LRVPRGGGLPAAARSWRKGGHGRRQGLGEPGRRPAARRVRHVTVVCSARPQGQPQPRAHSSAARRRRPRTGRTVRRPRKDDAVDSPRRSPGVASRNPSGSESSSVAGSGGWHGGEREHVTHDSRHVHLRDPLVGPRPRPDHRRSRTALTAGIRCLRHSHDQIEQSAAPRPLRTLRSAVTPDSGSGCAPSRGPPGRGARSRPAPRQQLQSGHPPEPAFPGGASRLPSLAVHVDYPADASLCALCGRRWSEVNDGSDWLNVEARAASVVMASATLLRAAALRRTQHSGSFPAATACWPVQSSASHMQGSSRCSSLRRHRSGRPALTLFGACSLLPSIPRLPGWVGSRYVSRLAVNGPVATGAARGVVGGA